MNWAEVLKKNGIIYCQKKDTWCLKVDENTGLCTAATCNIGDRSPVAAQTIQTPERTKEQSKYIPDSRRKSAADWRREEQNSIKREKLMRRARVELARIRQEERRKIL